MWAGVHVVGGPLLVTLAAGSEGVLEAEPGDPTVHDLKVRVSVCGCQGTSEDPSRRRMGHRDKAGSRRGGGG